MGGATAQLLPIAWPEPFSLVLIEAMAVGAAGIAVRCSAGRDTNRRRFDERLRSERLARDDLARYSAVPSRGAVEPSRRAAAETGDD